MAPAPIMNLVSAVKGLPSVTEDAEVVIIGTPPQPPATSSNKKSLADSGGRTVRQKALEYEQMLVKQRISGSPCTPPPAVINQKTVHTSDSTTAEDKDMSRSTRRSSAASRRSSAAGKRKSLKILASKAKLRSLHGRPSLPRAAAASAQQQEREESQQSADMETQQDAQEAEPEKAAENEVGRS